MIDKINSINQSLPSKKIIETESQTKEKDIKNTALNRKKYDTIEVNRLIADNEKRINDFKETIRKMVVQQGEKYNLSLFGQKLNVSVEDSKKAAAAIADGGEYSIDAVATRIMDMAKALSAGDKSKIPLLREAVIKGFEAAGMEFKGGAGLPEISHKTYDEIMKRFHEWEKQ